MQMNNSRDKNISRGNKLGYSFNGWCWYSRWGGGESFRLWLETCLNLADGSTILFRKKPFTKCVTDKQTIGQGFFSFSYKRRRPAAGLPPISNCCQPRLFEHVYMVVLVINTEDVMCIMVVAFLKAKQPPHSTHPRVTRGNIGTFEQIKTRKCTHTFPHRPTHWRQQQLSILWRCVQFALFYRSRGRASRLFPPFYKTNFLLLVLSLLSVAWQMYPAVTLSLIVCVRCWLAPMRCVYLFSCLNSPVCSPFVSLLKKKTFRYVCVCVGVGADARRKRARKEREGVAENSGRNCHPGTRI